MLSPLSVCNSPIHRPRARRTLFRRDGEPHARVARSDVSHLRARLQEAVGSLVASELLGRPSAFYGTPGPSTVSSAMVVTDRGRRFATALSGP